MALYVTNQNQMLLWNVISKNNSINEYFLYSGAGKKEEWFKSVLRIFYEKNQNRNLSTKELLELNKETIAYMIRGIKQTNTVKTKEQPLHSQFLKPYSVTENKVEKIGNQFNEKQMEYSSMFEKKPPESIDFAEKQDTPLSNMDDIIKKHMRERDEELKKYSPPPIIPILNQNETQTVNNKLRIDDASDNINILIEEIKEKKSVSWSDDENCKKLENQQKEIDLLKLQIAELISKVKNLEETTK